MKRFLATFFMGLALVVSAMVGVEQWADAQAATATSTIYSGAQIRYSGTPSGGGTLVYDYPKAADTGITSGVGTNQADLLYVATRVLTASATEDLDLRGVLLDSFGTTLNFIKVKYIRISAASGNTNNVVVGNTTNAVQLGFGATTQSWSIPPGGQFLVTAPAAGFATTAATADLLHITNSAGSTSVTYTIEILGTSS